MKTECGQDMERRKTIHFSEMQLIRTSDYLGPRVMKEDKWKTILGEKGDLLHHWNSKYFVRARTERKTATLLFAFLLPLLSSVKEITGASHGKPALSSWSTASWGQGMLCVSFQRNKENWVNGGKLTNSFLDNIRMAHHCALNVQLIFFLKERYSLTLESCFPVKVERLLETILNNGKCAVILDERLWMGSEGHLR